MSANFIINPLKDNLCVIEDLVISLDFKSNRSSAVLSINPSITEYIEEKKDDDFEIRNLIVKESSDESMTLTINATDSFGQRFCYAGANYIIKFMGTVPKKVNNIETFDYNFYIEKHNLEDLQLLGGISSALHHEHADWYNNDNTYNFPKINQKGIFIFITKIPKDNLIVSYNGPLGQAGKIRTQIKDIGLDKIHFHLQWKDNKIELYLNGQLAETKLLD